MQKKDVLLVDYTGIDLVTGNLFESTQEAEARKGGIFDSRVIYRPVPVILGFGELLPALEKTVETMKVGETKTVRLEAFDAFGERTADKIRILSLRDFREQKMNPVPGMVIEADGAQGRVQSVSGGRVRCDFNHPLAGKPVEYKLVVQKKITEPREKAIAVLARFFPGADAEQVAVQNDIVSVGLSAELEKRTETPVLKKLVEKMLTERLDFKAVEFKNPDEKNNVQTASENQKPKKTDPA